MIDDGLDNLELIIVRGAWVRDSTILEEHVLRLITLIDEKIHVTPIINNHVRYVTLTIILRLHQGIKDSVPLLLKTLTLPGKHSSKFVMRNESHIVVLGRYLFCKSTNEGH